MTAARHREPPSTCAWAEATGGALDPLQRRRALRAIARGYLDVGVGLASRPMRRPVPVEIPTAPDSKLAREAETAAREQGVALAGHGYRTWLLGHALACQDRHVLDPELFYVAALLHDAGIVRVVAGEDFTIRSARVVSEVVARARPDDSSLATSLGIRGAHATRAQRRHRSIGFVQVGALADLAALRRWDRHAGTPARPSVPIPPMTCSALWRRRSAPKRAPYRVAASPCCAGPA
jgi:hypothetical protein